MSRDGKKVRIKVDPVDDVLTTSLSQTITEAESGLKPSLMELCGFMCDSLTIGKLSEMEKQFLISALQKIAEGMEPNKAFFYIGTPGNKPKRRLTTELFLLNIVNQFIDKGMTITKACQETINAIPQIISQNKELLESYPELSRGIIEESTLKSWYYREQSKQKGNG